MAASLGADGVMCLWAKSCYASHYGEILKPTSLKQVPVVLINPGLACETRDVFQAFDQCGQFSDVIEMVNEFNGVNIDCFFDYLKNFRNDLEFPATQNLPIIAEILNELNRAPQAKLSRMSGSGATCFALCHSLAEAVDLKNSLSMRWPQMWVRHGLLG